MKIRIREFGISEDVRVSATLGYVIHPGCDPSPVDPGEPPSAEIQVVAVESVFVDIPGLVAAVEQTTIDDAERKQIARYILCQGDILEDLQRGLMEERNESAD